MTVKLGKWSALAGNPWTRFSHAWLPGLHGNVEGTRQRGAAGSTEGRRCRGHGTSLRSWGSEYAKLASCGRKKSHSCGGGGNSVNQGRRGRT